MLAPNLIQNISTTLSRRRNGQIHINLEIQDSSGHHLEFQKNVNNSELDKDICTSFYGKMHHSHAEMTHQQKAKPEVYSRDVIK